MKSFRYMAPISSFALFSSLVWVLVMTAGCGNTNDGPASPFAGQTVRVLVIGDPPLAEAINRQGDNWKKRSGSEIQVQQVSAEDLASVDKANVDLFVMPSYLLGTLAEEGLLAPVGVDAQDDARLAWDQIYPLPRLQTSSWAGQLLSITLGEPVLQFAYLPELFAELKLQPPKTWAEYQSLIETIAAAKKEGHPATAKLAAVTLEPLGPGYAGLTLLARAASYGRQKGQYSTLFDIDTFEPKITSPAYERAMEDLLSAYLDASPDCLQYGPQDVCAQLAQGKAAMGLCWPSQIDQASASAAVQFATLPQADTRYVEADKAWQPVPENAPAVTLLAMEGRQVAVAKASPVKEAALQLAIMLAGDEWDLEISSKSNGTAMYRPGQMSGAGSWSPLLRRRATLESHSKALVQQLSTTEFEFALRIPDRPKYLTALDEAVWQVLKEDRPPSAALAEAAEKWQALSGPSKEGRLRTFRHSLGIPGI